MEEIDLKELEKQYKECSENIERLYKLTKQLNNDWEYLFNKYFLFANVGRNYKKVLLFYWYKEWLFWKK